MLYKNIPMWLYHYIEKKISLMIDKFPVVELLVSRLVLIYE